MTCPAPDQVCTPLIAEHLGNPLEDLSRRRPKGVPVEVDHALGKGKPIAGPRDRIGRVEDQGILS